jgi:hypothetical protein
MLSRNSLKWNPSSPPRALGPAFHPPIKCQRPRRRENFSTAGAQLGHQNFDWGTFSPANFGPFRPPGHSRGPAFSIRGTGLGWSGLAPPLTAETETLSLETETFINLYETRPRRDVGRSQDETLETETTSPLISVYIASPRSRK